MRMDGALDICEIALTEESFNPIYHIVPVALRLFVARLQLTVICPISNTNLVFRVPGDG